VCYARLVSGRGHAAPGSGDVCNGEMPTGEAMTAEALDTFGLLLGGAGIR